MWQWIQVQKSSLSEEKIVQKIALQIFRKVSFKEAIDFIYQAGPVKDAVTVNKNQVDWKRVGFLVYSLFIHTLVISLPSRRLRSKSSVRNECRLY